MYDLSSEIKKCLTKKYVQDVKKADLKTWFPELVNQDVPVALPAWPNATTLGHPPRHQLKDGLTPIWGRTGASPNPFDMATSQSMGMGVSPIHGLSGVDGADDRHSFASGPSRMSMGSLPGADYQGLASTQAQFHEFIQQTSSIGK